MQRSPQLVPLSHDHHVALEVALVLTRATTETRPAAAARHTAHWHERGARHFAAEEAAFTPALLPGDDVWRAHVERMLAEHEELRGLARELESGDPALPRVVRTGARLRDHVRFEERVLFPYAEAHLPAEALDEVGRTLHAGTAG
jgi:hypothetical protein